MTRERKPWTPEQVARLRALCARHETYTTIAEDIGRARGSCLTKARELGLQGGRCRSTQGIKGWARQTQAAGQ